MSIMKALEEFLKDIAQQQAAQQAKQRPPQRPPVRAARPAQPVQAEIVEEDTLRQDVSKHVAQHLDTSNIRRHTAELGSHVLEETSKLQNEVHEKFDHKLGSLKDRKRATEGAVEETGSPFASVRPGELAELLRNPASLRNAVILNEILQRPEHRW